MPNVVGETEDAILYQLDDGTTVPIPRGLFQAGDVARMGTGVSGPYIPQVSEGIPSPLDPSALGGQRAQPQIAPTEEGAIAPTGIDSGMPSSAEMAAATRASLEASPPASRGVREVPEAPPIPRTAEESHAARADAAQGAAQRAMDTIGRTSAVEQRGSELAAGAAEDVSNLSAEFAEDYAAFQEEKEALIEEQNSKIAGAIEEVRNFQVDPKRLWKDASVPAKIGAALGVFLGGAMGLRFGRPNEALAFIERQIDRDIAAQRDELGKLTGLADHEVNMLGQLHRNLGSKEQGLLTLKAAKLEAVHDDLGAKLARLKPLEDQERAQGLMDEVQARLDDIYNQLGDNVRQEADAKAEREWQRYMAESGLKVQQYDATTRRMAVGVQRDQLRMSQSQQQAPQAPAHWVPPEAGIVTRVTQPDGTVQEYAGFAASNEKDQRELREISMNSNLGYAMLEELERIGHATFYGTMDRDRAEKLVAEMVLTNLERIKGNPTEQEREVVRKATFGSQEPDKWAKSLIKSGPERFRNSIQESKDALQRSTEHEISLYAPYGHQVNWSPGAVPSFDRHTEPDTPSLPEIVQKAETGDEILSAIQVSQNQPDFLRNEPKAALHHAEQIVRKAEKIPPEKRRVRVGGRQTEGVDALDLARANFANLTVRVMEREQRQREQEERRQENIRETGAPRRGGARERTGF
jgi:hypothetical protein